MLLNLAPQSKDVGVENHRHDGNRHQDVGDEHKKVHVPYQALLAKLGAFCGQVIGNVAEQKDSRQGQGDGVESLMQRNVLPPNGPQRPQQAHER